MLRLPFMIVSIIGSVIVTVSYLWAQPVPRSVIGLLCFARARLRNGSKCRNYRTGEVCAYHPKPTPYDNYFREHMRGAAVLHTLYMYIHYHVYTHTYIYIYIYTIIIVHTYIYIYIYVYIHA